MVLAIAGNFDPDEALQIIEANLVERASVQIERSPYQERKEALCPRADLTMDVALPQFYLGFKQCPAETEADFLRQQFELEILHELLIGSTSACYEKLLRAGIINSTFGTEVFSDVDFWFRCSAASLNSRKRSSRHFARKSTGLNRKELTGKIFLPARMRFTDGCCGRCMM